MDLANVVNPLWGALPQDLQRNLVELTIQSRIEDQIERLRESILTRYGRLDSPLRHLDWHPRYIGMNIFYLPMYQYDVLVVEVRDLLWYLARKCTIGLILSRSQLSFYLTKWIDNPKSVTRLGSWLAGFMPLTEWEALLLANAGDEYMFIPLHVSQNIQCGNGETQILEEPFVSFEGSYRENPTFEPNKDSLLWEAVKLRMMELNGWEEDATLTELLHSHNYSCDGRIIECSMALPPEQVVRSLTNEATHNLTFAEEFVSWVQNGMPVLEDLAEDDEDN
ncbi:hypothetical protein LINPERPRIM_LOCUS30726 [Linum perenne]